MTDEELVRLLEEKASEDLSVEEIEAIRGRIPRSPDLARALAGRLKLEGSLAGVLGRIQVPVERILEEAGDGGGAPRRRRVGFWPVLAILILCSPVLVIPGAALLRSLRGRSAAPAEASLAAGPPAAGAPAAGGEPAAASPAREAGAEESGEAAVGEVTSPGRLVVEAEDFQQGNVEVDTTTYGEDIGVIYNSGESPNFAEYEPELPRAGQYRLELRYAAEKPRPVTVSINGRAVKEGAADQVTGSWYPDAQRWFTEGVYVFSAGKNLLRLEGPMFPHLDKLALAAVEEPPPEAPLAVAAAATPLVAEGVPSTTAPAPPVRPLEEARFEVPAEAPGREVLERSLSPVTEGGPTRIFEETRSGVRLGGFEGLFRLNAAWSEDPVFRIWLLDPEGFRLHLWNGESGVTLLHHSPGGIWAAYRASRVDRSPRPSALSLASTDGGRHRRSGAGPIELRREEGTIVASTGDVRLLTVPFAGPPREVYLEGRARVRDLSTFRAGGPLRLYPEERERPAVLSGLPSGLDWTNDLPPGARLEKLPGGEVELFSRGDRSARASVAVGGPGLFEFTFEVESPVAGTGVWIGDDADRPAGQVGFLTEPGTGKMIFGFPEPLEGRARTRGAADRWPPAYARGRVWLRLVAGTGILKCFTSGDGIHFGLALEPARTPQGRGALSRAGLYCLKGDGPRAIRLRRLEVRRLSRLEALAPRELFLQAPPLAEEPGPASWLRAAAASQPPGADAAAWRRASALRTLAAGPRAEAGRLLLGTLLEEALLGTASSADLLALFEEAGFLADGQEAGSARTLVERYERLGRLLLSRGEPRPFGAISTALVTSPVFTETGVDVWPEGLARSEILSQAGRGAARELEELTKRIRFFRGARAGRAGRGDTASLLEWARAQAQANLAGEGEKSAVHVPATWRHPLIEDLSREGYNILAEFQSALEGKSWLAACQTLASAGGQAAPGVLPDSRDPRLLLSLPVAVQLALDESEELRRTMREQFGPLGLLRVREAAASGDAALVEAAAVQFAGTGASAEAREWLGDRALAVGDFARALGQYHQALRDAVPSKEGSIAGRLQLAAALAGREEAVRASGSIEVGGIRIGSAELDGLVAEMRERASGGGDRGEKAVTFRAGPRAPGPSGYEARSRSISGEEKRAARQTKKRDANRSREKPAQASGGNSRPVAAEALEKILLLNDGIRVSAIDLDSGGEAWSHDLADRGAAERRWPSVPLRPAISGNRAYLRYLTKEGPALACLSLGGAVLWRSKPDDYVASDPVLIEDDLYALTVSVQGPALEVRWTTFDRRTGKAASQRRLTGFRDVWDRQLPCQATAVLDGIVASVGGTVAVFDLLGQPRWVRREPWLPLPLDPRWSERRQDPPVFHEGRVFICQDGLEGIECLDFSSGRVHWQAHLKGLRRLLGFAGGMLIAVSEDGLAAFDPAEGKRVWGREAPRLLEAELCAGSGAGGGNGILILERDRDRGGAEGFVLVWIDPASGLETARSPLRNLPAKGRTFGPFVGSGGRFFAVIGDETSRKREIAELYPSGPPEPGRPPESNFERWLLQSERAF